MFDFIPDVPTARDNLWLDADPEDKRPTYTWSHQRAHVLCPFLWDCIYYTAISDAPGLPVLNDEELVMVHNAIARAYNVRMLKEHVLKDYQIIISSIELDFDDLIRALGLTPLQELDWCEAVDTDDKWYSYDHKTGQLVSNDDPLALPAWKHHDLKLMLEAIAKDDEMFARLVKELKFADVTSALDDYMNQIAHDYPEHEFE